MPVQKEFDPRKTRDAAGKRVASGQWKRKGFSSWHTRITGLLRNPFKKTVENLLGSGWEVAGWEGARSRLVSRRGLKAA
jgi:hypothetical protein